MSQRNGDRARFQKNRKRKLHHRQRIRALVTALREQRGRRLNGSKRDRHVDRRLSRSVSGHARRRRSDARRRLARRQFRANNRCRWTLGSGCGLISAPRGRRQRTRAARGDKAPTSHNRGPPRRCGDVNHSLIWLFPLVILVVGAPVALLVRALYEIVKRLWLSLDRPRRTPVP